MWTPFLAVAGTAVDLLVRTVGRIDRIECFSAVTTLETLAMPFASLGQDLFGGKHHTAATRTTLARWGHNLGGVNHRSFGGVIEFSCLNGTATAVTLGSKLLRIANFAVHILVRTFTTVDRVEAFATITTLEASFMPLSSACQHLFGRIHTSTTSWTTLALLGHGRVLGWQTTVAVSIAVAILSVFGWG